MLIRRYIFLMLVFVAAFVNAQTDATRAAVVKLDGAREFIRPEIDMPASMQQQMIHADGFSYYTNSGGIYLIFPKTNNNVRLFALTGQLLWSGELVSGRFYIPTGQGIYFLRVNDKSYKVSCK